MVWGLIPYGLFPHRLFIIPTTNGRTTRWNFTLWVKESLLVARQLQVVTADFSERNLNRVNFGGRFRTRALVNVETLKTRKGAFWNFVRKPNVPKLLIQLCWKCLMNHVKLPGGLSATGLSVPRHVMVGSGQGRSCASGRSVPPRRRPWRTPTAWLTDQSNRSPAITSPARPSGSRWIGLR